VTEFFNSPSEKHLRRELRSNMPVSEVLLWSAIEKGNSSRTASFDASFSVGQFVIDFYSPEISLASSRRRQST